MKIARFLGSQAHAIYALAAVFLGAVALAALGSFVPDQALSALRALNPGATPFLQLLLLGWMGVVLGRMTIKPAPVPVERSKPAATARRETIAKDEKDGKHEKVDEVLRQVAKVLQAHVTDHESFSERLDGHNQRLSRHESAGPIKEIVLALIEDNRDMRDRLDNVRNQLEESRLQVVHLQTNLERAEEAGLRDVVTAIGNRRFFDASLMEEVEKARRLGDNICLALADIDRFKHVNDRFGHLVGDRLLRLFANILVQNVRGQDKVARFGGEEFALIFPGARLAEAVTAVERIRVVLESKQWTIEPSGERISKVTASFGIAKLRADESPNDLLRRADERLYEAKVQGRNRVVADDPNDEISQPTPRDRRATAI
jgi:diguanylate cyclase